MFYIAMLGLMASVIKLAATQEQGVCQVYDPSQVRGQAQIVRESWDSWKDLLEGLILSNTTEGYNFLPPKLLHIDDSNISGRTVKEQSKICIDKGGQFLSLPGALLGLREAKKIINEFGPSNTALIIYLTKSGRFWQFADSQLYQYSSMINSFAPDNESDIYITMAPNLVGSWTILHLSNTSYVVKSAIFVCQFKIHSLAYSKYKLIDMLKNKIKGESLIIPDESLAGSKLPDFEKMQDNFDIVERKMAIWSNLSTEENGENPADCLKVYNNLMLPFKLNSANTAVDTRTEVKQNQGDFLKFIKGAKSVAHKLNKVRMAIASPSYQDVLESILNVFEENDPAAILIASSFSANALFLIITVCSCIIKYKIRQKKHRQDLMIRHRSRMRADQPMQLELLSH